MFKLCKQIVKEINKNKMIWSHTIGGGLLDEPGKPGRRDCCLLRRVANRTALGRLCILAPRKK